MEWRKSSASSVILSYSASLFSPVGILVARQAYAGLSQVKSPASLDLLRISSLPIEHSLSGERMPYSRSALTPGLSERSSLALVPSDRFAVVAPVRRVGRDLGR